MTVESLEVISGAFAPNGVTTVFPFTFQVGATDEVSAYLDGVLVDPALYAVTLNDDGTGQATFFTAPVGTQLILATNPAFDQSTTFENQGPYFQSAIQRVVDDLAMRSLWLRERIAALVDFSFLTPSARAGKFFSWDVSGNPVLSSGTGSDAALRGDLAAPTGGALVGVRRAATLWAQPKSALDHILESAVSITEAGAVQDFDHIAGTGTDSSTTNFANMLADRKVGGIFIPPGEKGFKFTQPIVLRVGQKLIGAPNPSTHTSARSDTISKIAYRPPDTTARAFIRNVWGDQSVDVANLAIDGLPDGQNINNTAIQINGSYSNGLTNVSIWGTWNWGAVLHNTYKWNIKGFYTSGLAVFKTGNIAVGTYNSSRIEDLHTGNLPLNAATDKTYGILVAKGTAAFPETGGGSGLTIVDPTFQGVTVGLEVAVGGAAMIVVINPYHESIVCPMILGNGAGEGPISTTVIGGAFGGPGAEHPQYAIRGPLCWLRAGNGFNFIGNRWQSGDYVDGSTTGPWPVLMTGNATGARIENPNLFLITDIGRMLLREDSGSPAYYVCGHQGDYGGFTEWMKDGVSYGSNGFKIYRGAAGAEVIAAYQPVIIPAPITGLLAEAAPTIQEILVA